MNVKNSCFPILFRLNASEKIGFGHLSRCLTLATKLKQKLNKVDIYFAYKKNVLAKKYLTPKFKTFELNTHSPEEFKNICQKKKLIFSLGIIDIRKVNYDFLQSYNLFCKKIMVFDYEFKKIPPINLIVNGFVFENNKFLINKTKILSGRDFMVIRNDIKPYRKKQKKIKPKVENLLITLGGGDPALALKNIFAALNKFQDFYFKQINLVQSKNFTFHFNFPKNCKVLISPQNLGEIFFKSDLAICGGGLTLFELSYLGTPILALPVVYHQIKTINNFVKAKMCLGLKYKPSVNNIFRDLKNIVSNSNLRQKLSENSQKNIKGKGANILIKEIINLI